MDAVKTLVAASHASLSTTTSVITADMEDIPQKGSIVALIKMGTRTVSGFPGGLHFKRHRIVVRVARRLNIDQAQEDEYRLGETTLGLLLIDNAIEADLVRNNLAATIGGGAQLEEPLELVSQGEPRRLPDTGWIVIDQTYECSTCKTVTSLIA